MFKVKEFIKVVFAAAKLILPFLFFGFMSYAILYGDYRYDEGIPKECYAEKGDIVIEDFTNDTLKVQSLWVGSFSKIYTGDVTAKSRQGDERHLECREYKIINETD